MSTLLSECSPHLFVVPDIREHWPTPLPATVMKTHDLLFVAAQTFWNRWQTEGSCTVVLPAQPPDGNAHPHAALFTGFVKSLGWEIPRLRPLALLSDGPLPVAFEQAMRERTEPSRTPVIWHTAGRRKAEAVHAAPLEADLPPWPLEDGAVAVVSGGTGGLPTAVLQALTTRKNLDLWILGRSDIAALPEHLRTAADPQAPALRADLLRRLRTEHQGTPPRQLVATAETLLRAARANQMLVSLRAHTDPTRIHYLSCDVRDTHASRRPSTPSSPPRTGSTPSSTPPD